MHTTLPFLGFALPSLTAASKCGCTEVSFDVPVTSEVVVFSSPPDMANQTDITHFLQETWLGNFPPTSGTTPVTDTFTIKGTYCVPTKSEADTLEVLVHGITYNKTMWSGLGFSRRYDWHAHANARGYATLAIDRLGHGANPQHPDPLKTVQPQVQVDILHHILTAVRTGSPTNTLPQTFSKVVFVGHSYGSVLGAALASQYPTDADALVLTAYNSYVNFGAMAAAEWASAAVHDPSRFGGLQPGYIAMRSEAERTAAFYGPEGSFDAAIPRVDFKYQDTITLGEVAALPAILKGPAARYKGKVLVGTAVGDGVFCETPKEKCEGHLEATRAEFPDAEGYGFFAPEGTGHDLTLHHSAGRSFRRVHDWLDEVL